jgi:hypothetical protein
MASQSQYKEPGKGAGMKMGSSKAKAPVDKSGYDRSIKVPQATVDAVKKDGAKVAANKVTYGSPGYDGSTFSPTAPVSKEYKEATKRVYPNAKSTPPNASGYANPKAPGNSKLQNLRHLKLLHLSQLFLLFFQRLLHQHQRLNQILPLHFHL